MATQLSLLDTLERQPAPGPLLDALLTPDQIYESDDAALFCRLPEDNRFDLKGVRTQPRGLAPIFSAFSNGPSAMGGVLVFGINDKTREIEGCRQLHEGRLKDIECAAMVYCPSARVLPRRIHITMPDGHPDFIIAFRVNYVHDRLVCLTDESAFERIADKTKEIDDVRKQQIRVDKGERPFEIEACSLHYPDSFDIPAIKAFCERVRTSRGTAEHHKDDAILESLRLGARFGGSFIPNNACALLFAKDPRYAFPGAIVHFLKYKGNAELSGIDFNVEKDRQIEGNIGSIIREAAAMIDANLAEFTEWKGGKFATTIEYPRDAWYELLVNACVHRSYMFRNMPIFVKMFDDRIVFQSPGGLMPGVTPENIFERHHPRNRIIMDALRETGEVRCINEGTKRVRLEMARAGLPPPQFREHVGEGATVYATLFNDIAARSSALTARALAVVGRTVAKELTDEEKKIINHIAHSGKGTVTSIMEVLGDPRWHTVSVKLNRLAKRGILRFSSSKMRDPNAFYELIPKVEEHRAGGEPEASN